MNKLIPIAFLLLITFQAFSQKAPTAIVDESPSFTGGQPALHKFLADNVKYPSEAAENGIQGVVHIGAIVREDGTLDSITVIKGIGGGCDEEAIRVASIMPKWIPGKINGENTSVRVRFPVKFILKNTQRKPNRK